MTENKLSCQAARKLPPAIEPIYRKVWEEVVALHFKWTLYLDLYGSTEKIELINETAPGAFGLIEESLRADMVMTFNRLLDPPQMGVHENLTLQRLIDQVRPILDKQTADDLQFQFAEARRCCQGLIQLRNKCIGHHDLRTSLKYHENPLPGIGKKVVIEALERIAGVIHVIETAFAEPITTFDAQIMDGTGEHLMMYLKSGYQAYEHRREALTSGRG
jgi:hypothetical protein